MERKQWKNHGCSNNQQSTLFIPVLYMGIVDMTARLDSSAKSQNVCKQKNIESIILNSLTQTKITLFIYSWQDSSFVHRILGDVKLQMLMKSCLC